jgi:transcription-repair coupling factor (superfamily II helicase)
LFKQKFFGKGGYRKSYNSCPAMPYRDLVPNSSNLLPLPALPKPGARLDVPSLAGSSDALALAEIAGRNPGKLLAVITASAADAQRLLDEIPWFAPNLRVRQLPDWETLPYDHFSPHQDLVSERLATLWSTLQGQVDILLVPASTAVNRLAPPEFMAAYTFEFRKAQKLDAEKFRSQVTLAGYAHVTQVVSPGEYSIRGGLIDLFPMGSQLPYRLDLFDDEIESIKTFDVDTQRTVYPVPEVRLLPAREFPMDDKGRTHFRQAFRERFEGDPAKSGIYKDISTGIASAGIEYYLPLFFDEMASIFDYLPKDAIFATHGDAPGAIAAFWNDTRSRYNMLQGDKARPLLPPEELFLTDEAFFTAAKSYGRLAFAAKTKTLPENCPTSQLTVARRPDRRAESHLAAFKGRVLLVAETAGRRETLAAMFGEHGLKPAASADLAGFLAATQARSVSARCTPVLRWTSSPSSPKPSFRRLPAPHQRESQKKPLSTTG